MNYLKSYTPDVEQLSVDECFLDYTPIAHLYGDPVSFAHRLKDEVKETFGFTVNIGISSNKLLAKMAGDFEKPNKVHTLFPEEIESKLWPLPVRNLFLVGPATENKLKKMGIYTVGDLAKADFSVLREKLGKHGETIWHFANGRSTNAVISAPTDNKGYGNSTTTPSDVTDRKEAYRVLLSLCETVAMRMRKDNKCGRCVSIHLRTNEFQHFSHQ